MYAKRTKYHPLLFGYEKETNQTENDSDIKELYYLGSQARKRLLVYGGVHGYTTSGQPTGHRPSEPKYSFMLGDMENKRFTGIDFVYHSLAKYVPTNLNVTTSKQAEIASEIQNYLGGGYYVLLSWCFSKVWAESNNL